MRAIDEKQRKKATWPCETRKIVSGKRERFSYRVTKIVKILQIRTALVEWSHALTKLHVLALSNIQLPW